MAKKQQSDGDIESRITPVGEAEDHQKWLVYGRSGTGKTTLLATAPKPILLLDPGEKGTKSIKKRQGIDRLSLDQWDDFEQAYWYLEGKGSEKYKTVAVDTVTKLQDLAMSKVNPDGGQMAKNKWGEVSSLLKSWIILYRDLPMNVIFTAQDRERDSEDIEDEGTILPEVGPWTMPSVAKTLNAAVDVIGNTFIREREVIVKDAKGGTKAKTIAEFCLRIGPHARYVTKFRVDREGTEIVVPPFIISPTFDKLVKLQNGE